MKVTVEKNEKFMRRIIPVISLVTAMLVSGCIPNFKSQVICSKLSGKVTVGSQPAENVEVVRVSQSMWFDEDEVVQKVKTDANGNWTLPERSEFEFFSWAHQPVIYIKYKFLFPKRPSFDFEIPKMNYRKLGELPIDRTTISPQSEIEFANRGGELHLIINLEE